MNKNQTTYLAVIIVILLMIDVIIHNFDLSFEHVLRSSIILGEILLIITLVSLWMYEYIIYIKGKKN